MVSCLVCRPPQSQAYFLTHNNLGAWGKHCLRRLRIHMLTLIMHPSYHSTRDTRIPHKFICFDCRVHADSNWYLLKDVLYPQMLSKFKELALFRYIFIRTGSRLIPHHLRSSIGALSRSYILKSPKRLQSSQKPLVSLSSKVHDDFL